MPSGVFTTAVAPFEIEPANFGGASSFGLQIGGEGGVPTSWDVVLEISIDGTLWAESLRHSTEDGNGSMLYTQQNPVPVSHMRVRVISLALGPATGLIVAWSGA